MSLSKQEKLEKLDTQVLDLMLEWTGAEEDDITGDKLPAQTERLTELSVAVNYLKSNAIVEEKKKGTIEEDVKERKRLAQLRREENQSE